MKHKSLLVTYMVFLSILSLPFNVSAAQQLSIATVSSTTDVIGHTYSNAEESETSALSYNILSSTDRTVEVVAKNKRECEGDIVIPEKVNIAGITYTVIRIGEAAFSACSLTSISIPNSVTTIGERAFDVCSSLISITIPNSVTTIDDFAFACCYNLEDVTIPSTVEDIGQGVFLECTNLKSATINSSETGYRMFEGCTSLKDVQIGDNVTSINQKSFFGCTALTDCSIPNSVKIIKDQTFRDCANLKSITLGNSVEEIGDGCFSGTAISIINLPKSLQKISTWAFEEMDYLENITVDEENNTYASVDGVLFSKDIITLIAFPPGRSGKYEIPYGVTILGPCSFYQCHKLTEVIIPNSVLEMGIKEYYYGVFQDCTGLTKVVIPNSVKKIWDCCFAGCSNLSYIELPSSISYIRSGAFSGCPVSVIYYITDTPVELNEGLFDEQVYQNAILYCAQENISKYQETTPWNKFVNIRGVETDPFAYTILSEELATVAVKRGILKSKGKVEIPSQVTLDGKTYTVTEVEANGFENCTEITSVTLPATISKIGESAFDGCAQMSEFIVAADNAAYVSVDGMLMNKDKTELLICPQGKSDGFSIPETVKTVAPRAFFKCENLDKIELPKSVEVIGEYAFSGCTGLVIVDIPGSVKEIGEYAFAECENITNLFYITDKPIKADRNIFTESTYTNASLFYAEEHLNQYYRTIPWCFFKNMQGTSGIEDMITYDNADGTDIYNTQGIVVRANATAADIESLPAGLYIIGGKKVVVK